jgi:hypothetical protein
MFSVVLNRLSKCQEWEVGKLYTFKVGPQNSVLQEMAEIIQLKVFAPEKSDLEGRAR